LGIDVIAERVVRGRIGVDKEDGSRVPISSKGEPLLDDVCGATVFGPSWSWKSGSSPLTKILPALEGAETAPTAAAMARLINIRLYDMLSSRLLVLGAIEKRLVALASPRKYSAVHK